MNAVERIISSYYSRIGEEDIKLRFAENREFAFMFASGNVVRHRAFEDKRSLVKYLAKHVPMRAFASVGMYRHPSEPDMEKKELFAAELPFDIDADHLYERGMCKDFWSCLKLAYNYSVAVKDRVETVFGDGCEIHYSGRRGFHVVCYNEHISTVIKQEWRRKALDYIFGNQRVECRAGKRVVEWVLDKLNIPQDVFDIQVTVDVHRVIGVVGTIHGGSCLKVVDVPDGLDDIEVVVEMAKWMDGTMKVNVIRGTGPMDIFQAEPGVRELDANEACYLLANGLARTVRF